MMSSYRYIELTKGKRAIVDADDFDWLNQWKWHVVGSRYAARRHYYRTEEGILKSRYVYMHRQIVSTPEGLDTDHKNGHGLDNRRVNLRICTTPQNVANRGKLPNNTTGYKGVIFEKSSGKYVAQIGWQRNGDRKNHVIGRFNDPKSAAVAYDVESIKRYGEFAKLNFAVGG